jgi:hypothetical protein
MFCKKNIDLPGTAVCPLYELTKGLEQQKLKPTYHSLNAIVAQLKNCPSGVNTTI